ncbi:hypothetical protein Tco_1125517 [Tanacetum coccineum]|uniref:Uncharacterized protein n=1 Tax=Tanacetum coccineum TaxID=301880 RepID=A0ABQ5J965_9ASTR
MSGHHRRYKLAQTAFTGAGAGDVCLSRSKALTISFNSATSGDTPEVEALVLTLVTMALLRDVDILWNCSRCSEKSIDVDKARRRSLNRSQASLNDSQIFVWKIGYNNCFLVIPRWEPGAIHCLIEVLDLQLVLLWREQKQVCLLCEVILKQILAFDFFCASLESISAIEDTWEGEGLPTWPLYSWEGNSRVDEMILARVSSGFAGKKYGRTSKLYLGLLGGKEGF